MIKRMLILLVLISMNPIYAQDPVFTQFYAAPTILNPAFVGSTGNTRIGVGYRDQWIKNASKLSTLGKPASITAMCIPSPVKLF